MLTLVKFCGLCRPVDAAAAVSAGGAYAGVVLSPVGPRAQSLDSARAIHRAAAGARRVGVFVNEPAEVVRKAALVLDLDVVQLHGDERAVELESLREPARWEVWKAIRPRDAAGFLAGLESWGGRVDGLLLDGWSDRGAGGTGTQFPWSVVEPYRDRIPDGVRLIVAGGLQPSNVGEVVRRLQPDVVDVSSGVEVGTCIKSVSLMKEFVAAVRSADPPGGQEGDR